MKFKCGNINVHQKHCTFTDTSTLLLYFGANLFDVFKKTDNDWIVCVECHENFCERSYAAHMSTLR
jgi:hypothetical protein